MFLLLLPPKLGVGIAAVADTQKKNGTVGLGSEAQKGEGRGGPDPASTAIHRTKIKHYV